MTPNEQALRKLTAAQCRRFSDNAYALMQARTHREQLREQCERLSAEEFIERKELDAQTVRYMIDAFRRTDTWSDSLASHAQSVLEQHRLNTGHSGEDAANLWRALNEQFYRAIT